MPDRSTKGHLTGGHLGVYGLKTWGATYLAASANYARFDNSTTRTIAGVGPTENAAGNFASDQLSARLELGWKRAFANYTLTPFVAIEPAALWSHGYTETSTTVGGAPGVLGLSFAPRTTTSLPTFLGVQADTRIVFANGAVVTPLRAGLMGARVRAEPAGHGHLRVAADRRRSPSMAPGRPATADASMPAPKSSSTPPGRCSPTSAANGQASARAIPRPPD